MGAMKGKGIFSGIDSLIWDPDKGGFESRTIKLTVYGRNLVSPAVLGRTGRVTEGQLLPSAVRNVAIKISSYQAGPARALISQTFGDKGEFFRANDTFGLVSAADKVRIVRTSKSQNFPQKTTLTYTLPDYVDDVFIKGYKSLAGREIEVTVDVELDMVHGSKSFRSVLPLKIKKASTEEGRRFVNFKDFRGQAHGSKLNKRINFATDILRDYLSVGDGINSSPEDKGSRNYLPFSGADYSQALQSGKYTLRVPRANWGQGNPVNHVRDISFIAKSAKYSPLSFRIEHDLNPADGNSELGLGGSRIPVNFVNTPYLFNKAFSKYQLNTTTDYTENFDIDMFISSVGSGLDRGAGYGAPSRFKVKIPKGINSRVTAADIITREYAGSPNSIQIKVRGENLNKILSPHLIGYYWKGANISNWTNWFDKQVSLTGFNQTGIDKDEKTYAFTLKRDFVSFLGANRDNGYLYLAIKWTDADSGHPVYYAADDLFWAVESKAWGTNPITHKLDHRRMSEPWSIEGRNLISSIGGPNFDRVVLDVIFEDTTVGGINSESYSFSANEVTQVSKNSVVLQPDPSAAVVNYLRSGRHALVRGSLWKDNKEIIGTSVYSRLIGRSYDVDPVIEGLSIHSGVIVHNGKFEFSSPRGLESKSHLVGLLFESGKAPVDPLSISIQDPINPTVTGVVGYLQLDKERRNSKGHTVVQATVKITGNVTSIKEVDLVLLRNISNNSTLNGKYISYCAVGNMPLGNSITNEALSAPSDRAPWIKEEEADFYTNFTAQYGGNVANPSFVWESTKYRNASSSARLIGEAAPDTNIIDIDDMNQVGWKLNDKSWVQREGRRWHGRADVVIETPYPLTNTYTTNSIFIGREPVIEELNGDSARMPILLGTSSHYVVTVSGIGFSTNTYKSTVSETASVTRWESGVNGASFYTLDDKTWVSDLPYTTEVIRYPSGVEKFALDIKGAVSTSTISGYVVISTDYGSDWARVELPAQAAVAAGSPAFTTAVTQTSAARGGKGKVGVSDLQGPNGTWNSGVWLTKTDMTSVQNLTTHSALRLEYNSSLTSISEVLYALIGWKTGAGPPTNGENYLYLTDSNATASVTINTLLTVTDNEHPGKLGLHPGTGKTSGITASMTALGIARPSVLLSKTSTVYNGVSFTSVEPQATHRSGVYSLIGNLSSASEVWTNYDTAFTATASGTYSSTTAGGISLISINNTDGTSSYCRYYGVALSASDTLTSASTILWEPLGSQGSAVWGLGKNTADGGFGIPGASNTPWGLFSIDRESSSTLSNTRVFTKHNLLGKPKVWIKSYSGQGQETPYVRIDTPVRSWVRGPWNNTSSIARAVISGNNVSPEWTAQGNFYTPSASIEAFIPLDCANYGRGPSITGASGVWLGSQMESQVQYLDSSGLHGSADTKLYPTHYATQFGPEISDASANRNSGSVNVTGVYQKDLRSSHILLNKYKGVTLSAGTEVTNHRFHDYQYLGALYTTDSSSTVSGENRLVAVLYGPGDTVSNTAFINSCDYKSLNMRGRVIEPIVAGKTYYLKTQNLFDTRTHLPVVIPAGATRGDQNLNFRFLSGLRASPQEDRQKNKILTFPYVSGKNLIKDLSIITQGGNKRIDVDHASILDVGLPANGEVTVKVKPIYGHEFGTRETLGRSATRGLNPLRPRDIGDYFFTRSGKKPVVRLTPSLSMQGAEVTEGAANYLIGLPPHTGQPNLVLLIRSRDGITAPIPDLALDHSRLRFTPPPSLARLGFLSGDVVRLGVQTTQGEVFVSEREYSIGTLAAKGSSGARSVNPISLPSSEKSRVRWPGKENLSQLSFLAVRVPTVISSSIHPNIPLDVFLTNKVVDSDSGYYILSDPPIPFQELLTHEASLNFVALTTTNTYFFTNNNPVRVISTSRGISANSSINGDYHWPPKMACSYIEQGTTASIYDELNPKVVNHNIIYWSESVAYTQSGVSTTVKWPYALGYGAGMRIRGRHLINKKEELPSADSPYTVSGTPQVAVNYRTEFFANMYKNTSSNVVTSAPSYPGAGYVTVSADNFVEATALDPNWARPIYAKSNTAQARLSDIEWQEVALRIGPGTFYDTPSSVVYGGVKMHSSDRFSFYPDGDAIDESDLVKVPLNYINLDEVVWAGENIPTPVIDNWHPLQNENTVTYSSHYDIAPRQISNVSGKAIIRISGANLVGNLNCEYYSIQGVRVKPHLSTPVTVTLTTGSSIITASTNTQSGRALYGDVGGNNSSRLYAFFDSDTGSTWTSDLYDLNVETSWMVSGSMVTLSATAPGAVYVTSSPQVEIMDERISWGPDQSVDYSTGSAANPMQYATMVWAPNSGGAWSAANDVRKNEKLRFLLAQEGSVFGTSGSYSALTASVYEVWKTTARDFGLYDRFLSITDTEHDANCTPVVFSRDLTGSHPWYQGNGASWWKYRLPDLFGSTAGVEGTYSDTRSYVINLGTLNWDYGVETTTTSGLGYAGSNDLSGADINTKGAWSHKEHAFKFYSHHMPRIRDIVGVSADNIVNYVDGKALPGNGKPRVHIELVEQDTLSSDSASKHIAGINLSFKGGSIYLPRGTSGPYGDVEVFRGGSSWFRGYTLVAWTPNKTAVKLISSIRTGGWIDMAVVYEYPDKPGEVFESKDFKTLRVDWTQWDTEATVGSTIVNNPPGPDAFLYRMRVIKDPNDKLRFAWGCHFDRYLREISHQEPILDATNDDWFVVAGTAKYDKATATATLRLYGARERDMVYDIRNANSKGYFSDQVQAGDPVYRDARRGMQLLGEATIPGSSQGMAWIDDNIFKDNYDIVTTSDFKLNVGRSPHANKITDSIGSNYSITHGQLLGADYIDADLSDIAILPRHGLSLEDAGESVVLTPRREWLLYGDANLCGRWENRLSNPDFEDEYINPSATMNGTGSWYAAAALLSAGKVTISDSGYSSLNTVSGSRALILRHIVAGGADGAIAQNAVLRGNSAYDLDFYTRSSDSSTARIPSLSLSIEASVGAATYYYSFIEQQWSTSFSSYMCGYYPWWKYYKLPVHNNLVDGEDMVAQINFGIIPGVSTFAAENYDVYLDNISLRPASSYTPDILNNGTFDAISSVGGSEVPSFWTLGSGATHITASEGTNKELVYVPVRGRGAMVLSGTDINSWITSSIEEGRILPYGNYVVRLDAWSTNSDVYDAVPLYCQVRNKTQNKSWDGEQWIAGSTDYDSISVETNAFITISGLDTASRVAYGYEIPLTLEGANADNFTPDDDYELKLTIRPTGGHASYVANVGVDSVYIQPVEKYETTSNTSSYGGYFPFRESLVIGGKSGAYIAPDDSWDFRRGWSGNAAFNIRQIPTITGSVDTVSALTWGHGPGGKGSGLEIVFNQSGGAQIVGYAPISATQSESFESSTLSPFRWYWAGISHSIDYGTWFGLYEYDSRPWVQGWSLLTELTTASYAIGADAVTNGDFSAFDAPTTHYTLPTGWSITSANAIYPGEKYVTESAAGNQLEVIIGEYIQGSDCSIYQASLTPGATYILEYEVVSNLNGGAHLGGWWRGDGPIHTLISGAVGVHRYEAKCYHTWARIVFNQYNQSYVIDNVKFYEKVGHEFPMQPISIGYPMREFFQIDNWPYHETTTGGIIDLAYTTNRRPGAFIWRFNEAAETVPNAVMYGSDSALSVSDVGVFYEDNIWGGYSADPRRSSAATQVPVIDNQVTVTDPGATIGGIGTSTTDSIMAASHTLHSFRSITIASWSKITRGQSGPTATVNDNNCIFMHGGDCANIVAPTTDLFTLKTFEYLSAADQLSTVSIGLHTDSSDLDFGVSLWNNIDTSHPSGYLGFFNEARFGMYLQDSTYQIGGVNAKYGYLKVQMVGADAGVYNTQSVGEWWLNLASMRISSSNTFEISMYRIPASEVNNPGIFTFTDGDAYVSISKYGLYSLITSSDVNVHASMSDIANFAVIDKDASLMGKLNTGTEALPVFTQMTVQAGTDNNGLNTYSGNLSEILYLPGVFARPGNMAEVMIQAGAGGFSPPEFAPAVIHIAQAEVAGHPIHDDSGLVEGTPLKDTQTRATLNIDQENIGPRDKYHHDGL